MPVDEVKAGSECAKARGKRCGLRALFRTFSPAFDVANDILLVSGPYFE